MEDFEKVIEEARNKLVRNDTEKVKTLVDKVIEELNEKAKEKGLNVEIMLTGSYARGTWVLGESDVDIYVIFNSEEETKFLKEIVPNGFVVEEGTRKYFVGNIDGVKFEIVPIVKINSPEEAKNSLDLSVSHTSYVLSKLNDKLSKDIALLKMFLKAIHCYGAESYMQGFSGYLTEVLIIQFNGLENLFRSVIQWRPRIIIDPFNEKREFKEPLVVIDPTNSKRNLAASLSMENLAKFVFSVKKFVSSPGLEYFTIKDQEQEIEEFSKTRNSKLIKFNLDPKPPIKVYYSKLKHKIKVIEKNMNAKGHNVRIYLIPENNRIIAEVIPHNVALIKGPSVFQDMKDVIEFANKHNTYVIGEFLAYDKILPSEEESEDIIKTELENLLKIG